ncbi:MAG TPA: zinc ABC transporter substrate-binding protein [bacterium]|nr:zinc ABC transporter substrate-binding protein [bacterium]
MTTHRRRAAVLLALLLAGAHASAQQAALRVVATNSWTAALASAAGATTIVTLAPSTLRHPAEYDLKPSDVELLSGADLIVYTGFEVMAKKLADAAGTRKIRLLQIGADYSLATMRASLMAIAAVTGTTDMARKNLAALEAFMGSWKDELRATRVYGAPILVHVFQQPLMAELGFTIKGVFGPDPLEAAQITRLSAEDVRLVVDNWHNEDAAPLKETMKKAHFASLINFPGPAGTLSLLDVLIEDRARLKAAAGY